MIPDKTRFSIIPFPEALDAGGVNLYEHQIVPILRIAEEGAKVVEVAVGPVHVVLPEGWLDDDSPILHKVTCSGDLPPLTPYGDQLVRRLRDEGMLEVGSWDGTRPLIAEEGEPGDEFWGLEFELEPLV